MKRFLLMLALVACGDDSAASCPSDASLDGAMRSVEVGSGSGSGFSSYVDGSDQPIVMGLQGGYMVVPVIRIPVVAMGENPGRVLLSIDNSLDDGLPAPSFAQRVPLSRNGDYFESPPLENFLGYLRGELIGRRLTMELRVESACFDLTNTTVLQLTEPI